MVTASKSAPGELELVREFVNTLEVDGETRSEELRTPQLLKSWLEERDLLPRSAALNDHDLTRALVLREALRGILLAHNGAPLGREPFEAFDAIAAEADLRVRMVGDDTVRLDPSGSGLDGVIGRIAAIVYRSEVEGTWPRLKACAAEDCQWAFYDASRNRSGTWCDMASCGNRAKVRAYRERTRART
jgi:predicted RNA-binding Zn ribbon-like protein